MRDEHDRDPVVPQLANQREQPRGFRVVEGGRRFVHHQNTGVEDERFGDLDNLLLRNGEVAGQAVSSNGRAKTPQPLLRSGAHRRAIEHAPASRLHAQEDVLCNGAVRQQAKFLVNDADAKTARFEGMVKANRHAIDADLAGLGRVDAAENLHQGGLSGAILAAERMDLACRAIKRHIVEGQHARKSLADVLHRKAGHHFGVHAASAQPRRIIAMLSANNVSTSGNRSRQIRVAAASAGTARPKDSTVSQRS
jgi:hypothetical protein